MVPASEIDARIARFQEALRAAGLDAALIVQETDLYYLTGTAQSAHLIVPADGRADAARPQDARAGARGEPARSGSSRCARCATFPARRSALDGGRLGLELDVLPAASYLRYQRRLPGIELADCSGALRRIRSLKSAYELERIRAACEQVSHIGEWMARHVREGMTELELAAEIERELRLAGHQGVDPLPLLQQRALLRRGARRAERGRAGCERDAIVGPGPNLAVSKGASQRPIGKGEPILVDLAGAHDGYLSDQTRMFSSAPSARYAETPTSRRRSCTASRPRREPGVTGAALYDLALELAGGHEGFMGAGDERVTFVGHGIGLEIDELPLLARGWEEPFEPGWSSRSSRSSCSPARPPSGSRTPTWSPRTAARR